MDTAHRVQRLSRILRILFTIVLITIPVIQILFWIFFNRLPEEIVTRSLPIMVPIAALQDLPLSSRLLALGVNFISTAVVMACVYYLIRLFMLYEKEQIFTAENVGCLRVLGRLLIVLFFADIVESSLLSVALTLHNPPGQRMITFGLSSDEMTTLLFGIVVVLIAWVMDEGRKLQEEQQLTV